jgi:hypothetical protein
MFSVIPKLAPPMYVYSQFNLKHGASVQIKPDQIKSKRRSLGLKHNRPGARTGHLLNILTRTNHQICTKSLGDVPVQIKPDQIKSKRRSLGLKHNRSGARTGHLLNILTRTNHQICTKSLGDVPVQIKPDQIKSKHRSLGLKHNRPEARTGHILNIDPDKSPNLSEVIKECLGSTQTCSNRTKYRVPRSTTVSESTNRSNPSVATWRNPKFVQVLGSDSDQVKTD